MGRYNQSRDRKGIAQQCMANMQGVAVTALTALASSCSALLADQHTRGLFVLVMLDASTDVEAQERRARDSVPAFESALVLPQWRVALGHALGMCLCW